MPQFLSSKKVNAPFGNDNTPDRRGTTVPCSPLAGTTIQLCPVRINRMIRRNSGKPSPAASQLPV